MTKPAHSPRPLLGAILEQKFGLSEAKLLEALNIQQTKGGRLGEALLKIRADKAAPGTARIPCPAYRAAVLVTVV